MRNHKGDNPLDILEDYENLVNEIMIDNPNRYNDQPVINNSFSEENIENEVILDESRDIEKSKFNYGQYLLEMTYQYKLTAKTVDDLNTKKLVLSFLDDLKV